MAIEVDARAAGFEEAKLARIGEHLRTRYVEPGKIPGVRSLFLGMAYPPISNRWD